MPNWFEEYIKEEKDKRTRERGNDKFEDVMKNMDEKKTF